MVYRRTEREMTAYAHEYEFMKKEGVDFRVPHAAGPRAHRNGAVTGLECVRVADFPKCFPARNLSIPADHDHQSHRPAEARASPRCSELETDRGFIKVDESFETSVPGIYAGGDCIRAKGAASTVMAAQDGKIAAAAIHSRARHKDAAHG